MERFRNSLRSDEPSRSLLAAHRAALRATFEKEHQAYWAKRAEEARLRPNPRNTPQVSYSPDTDSAAAFAELGPRQCFRALERSWRQRRDADVLFSIRLGDALDHWNPFDDHTCPCDPGFDRFRFSQGLGPIPRPCTSRPLTEEDMDSRDDNVWYGDIVLGWVRGADYASMSSEEAHWALLIDPHGEGARLERQLQQHLQQQQLRAASRQSRVAELTAAREQQQQEEEQQQYQSQHQQQES